jgi:uncharacterized membrane protein (Fun14 family)
MSDIGARILAFVLPLLPGFVIGYVLGRIAGKALSRALLIGGALAVALFLLGRYGFDTSTVEDWLRSASSWAGDQVEGAARYLAALLPPVAALGIGIRFGLVSSRRG